MVIAGIVQEAVAIDFFEIVFSLYFIVFNENGDIQIIYCGAVDVPAEM